MSTLLILIAIYFLPAFVAYVREHPYRGSILVVNLFLGWTLLGWVVALAWGVAPVSGAKRCS